MRIQKVVVQPVGLNHGPFTQQRRCQPAPRLRTGDVGGDGFLRLHNVGQQVLGQEATIAWRLLHDQTGRNAHGGFAHLVSLASQRHGAPKLKGVLQQIRLVFVALKQRVSVVVEDHGPAVVGDHGHSDQCRVQQAAAVRQGRRLEFVRRESMLREGKVGLSSLFVEKVRRIGDVPFLRLQHVAATALVLFQQFPTVDDGSASWVRLVDVIVVRRLGDQT